MPTKPFKGSLDPADWPTDTRERAVYLDRLLDRVICVGCDTTPRKAWMGMLTGELNYGLRCACWPEMPKPVQQIYHVDERRWNMVKNEMVRRPDDLPAITIQDVKEHLASKATDPELELFVRFCVSQDLNPFAREAHLIKIQGQPAYIQVDYKVLFRLAHRDPDYDRYKSGVTILVDDNVERRAGSMVLPAEQLVGGWCKVWMKGQPEPLEEEVGFTEFDTGQALWKKKPGFMIEKVAITTAFRRAVRGIEDLMGAAAAMRVEAAEVGPAITEAAVEYDPTVGGLYEAPERQSLGPNSPAEAISEAPSMEEQGNLSDSDVFNEGRGEPENDGGPPLFPPGQASASPEAAPNLTDTQLWKALREFGLNKKEHTAAVEKLIGQPLAETTNLQWVLEMVTNEHRERTYRKEQAGQIENTERT